MKKYLLGILAIVMAVGFSAFTGMKELKGGSNSGELYWFQIGGSYNPGAAVASADAAFLQFSVNPPAGSGCSSGAKQCVSGFASSDVVAQGSSFRLKDNLQQPEQQPAMKP